jgi:hypothetical protein
MGKTRARRRRLSELSLGVALLSSGFLPGCPPSDDYFIDPSMDAQDVSGGVPGGVAGEGGGSGSLAGSGGALGGTAGLAGMDGKGGKGGATACVDPCNAGRSCDTGCEIGWVATSPPPGGFSPRERAAYVSLGNQLFVWGGLNESGTALNSGALYDPRTNQWRMIAADANTPSPRSDASAVWTGTIVVVWGGYEPSSGQGLADGAIYDPVENAWRAMADGPNARVAAIAGANEEIALFWAGQSGDGTQLSGLDIYDTDSDSWFSADASNEPSLREEPAWAAGLLTFWAYGGRLDSETGSDRSAYYSISSDSWNTLPEGATAPRWGSYGALVDGNFYVWGGRDVSTTYDDGVVYSSGDWDGIDGSNAPSARYAASRESGWAFVLSTERFAVVAGLESAGSYLRDGGIYDRSEDAWTTFEAWPHAASHAFGAAGFVAGEIVVWGGRDGASLTNTGVRYLPAN